MSAPKKLTLNPSLNSFTKMPSRHLMWSILTLFFFLPLGVIALINAIKVDSLLQNGFYDQAKQVSLFVKIITIIGMTVGVVTYFCLALVLGSIYFFAI
jgi:hypothetical protein